MQTDTESNLNLAEISAIWNAYIHTSAEICVFEYFLSKCKDAEIHFLMEYVKSIYTQRNMKLINFFNLEGLPLPKGFANDDVNINVPNLFTDSFYLWYLNSTLYFEMSTYTYILNSISRSDLRDYFTKIITESIDLLNKDVDLLTSKGIFIDPPKVEVLKQVAYVKEDSFLGSWFGEPRSLISLEVTTIYMKILYNTINKAFFGGFGQVAASKQVSDFMFKGRDIAVKHIEELSEILNKENIPVPSTSESFITGSATSPFSDKLIIFLSLKFNELLLLNAGFGIISSMRKDLQADFTRHASEYSKYALDCIHIMIDNEWLEQPPQVLKSENLAKC